MAITKTAKRSLRVANRKKIINDKRTKTMKLEVKELRVLISKKDLSASQKKLSTTFKALDKAVKGGIIKKGKANRNKSRLAKAIAQLAK